MMLLGAFVAPAALAQTADLVAVNGKVFTARDGATPTQAFAIKDGRFVAVGSSAAIRARHLRGE
jgi:predicted amidohydrolase YtcJ